jgi:sulfoxide reductase heme-binding subunit YedZ
VVAALLASGVVVARLMQNQATGTATWDASRAAGFAAYLLLWVSVVTGVGLHLRVRPVGAPLTWMLEVHRITSTLGLSFVVAHVFALVLDPVVPFSWVDAVVPFTSSFRTLQVGAGTVALWLMVAVLVSTATAGSLPWRMWRGLHFLSFPCFFLALVHGLTSGSDTASTPGLLIYACTAAAVAAACVARFFGRNWVPAEA